MAEDRSVGGAHAGIPLGDEINAGLVATHPGWFLRNWQRNLTTCRRVEQPSATTMALRFAPQTAY